MIEEQNERLKELIKKYNSFCAGLKKDHLSKEFETIKSKLTLPEVYNNFDASQKFLKEQALIESKLSKIYDAERKEEDAKVAIELAQNGEMSEEETKAFVDAYSKIVDELYLETLYSGEYDDADSLIMIHSGAGGEEAQDWTDMLARMYLKFASKYGYSADIVDKLVGDGAGYKSISIIISGKHAYGNLKTERGVHRLVRLSPFDSNNRRHTSFASVEVSPMIESSDDIQINPSDLKIDTYKSSGAGGQHVNKTESAIRITHKPTGIVVACQNERSQVQNKAQAMKMLYSKLAERKEREKDEERQKNLSSQKKIEWGSQIRSYVLHPYNMVKDHRTNLSTSNTTAVLDGEIMDFIIEAIKFEKE